MPVIEPITAVVSLVWWRDKGLSRAAFTPEDAYGPDYQRSPVRYVLERRLAGGRWNLGDPAVVERFAVFEELRPRGVTEYVLRYVPFGKPQTELIGIILSLATDRPGGFADADIAVVDRILPALGLVAYRIALLRVAAQTLAAYLGPRTGARVLKGMVRRGNTEIISAALLLADLRGFTAFAGRHPSPEVVGRLNQHLECIGDAVTEHGGEVLKFLGDGLLAVFASEPRGAEWACRQAVDAAIDARQRNAALNGRRAAQGGPALDVSIALHFGDLAYGNIGTARRLDFTVVGPALNEVSRMETLGKALGHDMLLSENIAGRCGHPVLSVGAHKLRGIAGTREMYVRAT
jgi:adenylate cyclase